MGAIKITAQNFEQEVTNAQGTVMVDFNASWCGPCQMLAPVIEELAEEYAGKVKVGTLDIDEELSLAKKYRVLSVPTVVLFKDGREADRKVGFQDKYTLEQWINA